MLEHKRNETINGVSPEPITNKEFTKAIAKQLNKPLWLPNVPTFLLRVLVGKMADILVSGNRVSSQKIEKSGFKFQFPTIGKALSDLFQ